MNVTVPSSRDEDVAGMRIRVKEAVDQEHLDRGSQRTVGDDVRVEAGPDDLVDVRDLDARSEVHRQDPLGGEAPDDAWHRDALD